MPSNTAESLSRACPITGAVCTCEAGPVEEMIPVEVNGKLSRMTIEKCGEIAVKRTVIDKLQQQVNDNTYDD